jgi:hypothetical protein
MPIICMKSWINRRETAWLVGAVVWAAIYFESVHLGVGGWYAFGLGSLGGAITVVIMAALICNPA